MDASAAAMDPEINSSSQHKCTPTAGTAGAVYVHYRRHQDAEGLVRPCVTLRDLVVSMCVTNTLLVRCYFGQNFTKEEEFRDQFKC